MTGEVHSAGQVRHMFAALLCAFAVLAGFISHDAGHADSNADVKLVVILASGWTSDSKGWSSAWQDVTRQLHTLGDQVVVKPYSYTFPNDYDGDDTQQPITVSADVLTLEATKQLEAYPNALIMVVGHSEGGVVATYWLAHNVPALPKGSQTADRLKQSTVVTLDSPVKGLDWGITKPYGNVASYFGWDKIPAELQPRSAVVTAMRGAATAPNYYNIASIHDELIHFPTAILSTVPGHVLKIQSTDECTAIFNAQTLLAKATGSAEGVWGRCAMDSHGEVLHSPDAIRRVIEIAKNAMASAGAPPKHTSPEAGGSAVAGSSYLLPWAAGSSLQLTQGNCELKTGCADDHRPASSPKYFGSEYAFDFGNHRKPFQVLAAQGGTVIGVESQSEKSCKDDSCWTGANFVLVDSGDGTSQLYMHFEPNTVSVHVGDRVAQGQPLGTAGMTGWSTGIHVHFEVEHTPDSHQPACSNTWDKNSSGWWWQQSVKVAFDDADVAKQFPTTHIPALADPKKLYDHQAEVDVESSNTPASANAIPASPCTTPTPAKPAAPTNVACGGSPGPITWSEQGAVDGFKVYSQAMDNSIDTLGSVPPDVHEWDDVHLGDHTYGVSAFNKAGESPITWLVGGCGVPPTTPWDGTYVQQSASVCGIDLGQYFDIDTLGSSFTVAHNEFKWGVLGFSINGSTARIALDLTTLSDGQIEGMANITFQFSGSGDAAQAKMLGSEMIDKMFGLPVDRRCSVSASFARGTASNTVTTRVGNPSLYVPSVGIPRLYPSGSFPEAIQLAADDWIGKLAWGYATDTYGMATAQGTWFDNDCRPDCAEGHITPYPLTIAASQGKTCSVTVVDYYGNRSQREAFVFTVIHVASEQLGPDILQPSAADLRNCH